MRRYTSALLVLLVFCFLSPNVFSQKRSQFNGKYIPPFGVMSFTGSLGFAYYYGDLNNKPSLKHLGLGPAISLGGLYRITEHLSARGELRFYQVSGNQQYSQFPIDNLSFRSRNPDLNLGIQADLIAFNRRPKVNPYLFLGLSATYLNTKTKFNGDWVSLPPLTTEGVKYSRLPLSVSGGLGISYQAFERLSLGLEMNSNFMFSDYLDDVSTVYPNPDLLPSDLARQLSDRSSEIGLEAKQPGWHRGVGDMKDIYTFFQLRATYLIGTRMQAIERKKTRCPKF